MIRVQKCWLNHVWDLQKQNWVLSEVFLTNVHSEGSGTHPSSSKNTFRRTSWRRSHWVQLLFAWKWLERRDAALAPDAFGSRFQVIGPNTAEWFGFSGLMLRSIQSHEEETTKPSCSTSACAGVIRVWVIATFSAYCSRPSPLHPILFSLLRSWQSWLWWWPVKCHLLVKVFYFHKT